MSVFNALEFDGINSLDYGIYITGEAAFNSPQRAVEAVTVPGRNGDILLDQGHYENIEVTYHAGVFGMDQSEFASKIQTFRNLLASRIGYKRITDTYNTGEYRLGTFIAPVDVLPDSYNRVGEFDIVFNCKPQRFLTSGETAVTVENGDIITNPTPFDAQPLLAIEGYGTIGFNGYEVEIENAIVGDVIISGSKRYSDIVPTGRPYRVDVTYPYEVGLFESNDTITVSGLKSYFQVKSTRSDEYFFDAEIAFSELSLKDATISGSTPNGMLTYELALPTIVFAIGTTDTRHYYANCDYKIGYTGGGQGSGSASLKIDILHYPDGRIRIDSSISMPISPYAQFVARYVEFTSIAGTSTKSILGDPTYIDCEFGEAYMISDGDYVSLNEYIDLGSDLPTLAPGNNEFTFDDSTMTDVQLTPRWWIL